MTALLIGRIGLISCIFGLTVFAQNPGQRQAFPCSAPIIRNLGGTDPGPDLGQQAYTPGTVVTISCRDGFILEGPSSITCVDRNWQVPSGTNPPICRPIPPVVPSPNTDFCNGQCSVNSNCALVNGQPRCVCQQGYTPSGGSCQRDPSLGTQAPVCRGGCPVENSICAIFQGTPLCICEVGYIEVGRSCQSRNLVQPAPDQCGVRGCPENSQCSLFNSNTPACVCNPGYLVFQRRGCTPRPTTAPSVDGCRRPPEIRYRNTVPDRNQQIWATGSIIIYECDDGYVLTGRRRARCLASGRFMFTPPTCTAASAVTPRTTQPPAPTPARIVRCPRPNLPANIFIRPRQISYVVNQEVQLVCTPPLTNVGDTTSTCQADGQFSAATPSCVAVQPTVPTPTRLARCPLPTLPPNVIIRPTQRFYAVDQQVEVLCRPPLNNVGDTTSTCQANGQFSAATPSCVAVQPPAQRGCRAPTAPVNGFIRPRQASYVVNQEVEFVCRPPLTNAGDATARCQANGQFSEASPACVAVQPTVPTVDLGQSTCVIPIAPENGILVTQREVWRIGSIADYRCNVGYRLVGFARSRCMPNGLFGSPPPICRPAVTCPLPVIPFGGSISTPQKTQYVPFDRVTYQCRPEYTLIGNAVIVCGRDGRYTTPFPSCGSIEEMATAGPVMCLNPNVPTNGYTIPRGQTVWTPDSVARFACNSGYTLVGADTARCLDTGSFATTTTFCISTDLPTPAPVTCSRPANPINGFVVAAPEKQTWQVEENIRYDCNNPYVVVGSQSAVCQESGNFSPQPPTCEAVTPEPLSCPRPEVPINAVIVGDEGRTNWQLGDTLEWACNSPYRLIGDRRVTCQENGGFGFTPICVAQPTAPSVVECQRLSAPTNGEILGDPAQTLWQVGENLIFNCFRGFNLVGNEYVTCQNNGNFNGITPTCEQIVAPITCPQPPRPANGFIVNPRASYNENERLTIACNSGYELVGSSQATCQSNRRFSGALPTCRVVVVAVTCPVPPRPDNGFIVSPQTTYNERDTILFRCNDGYELVGSEQAVCQNNGRFSGFLPGCRALVVVITCPVPPSPTNGIIVDPRGTYNENDVISFRCNNGFELVGSSQATCQSDGTFSGFLPICRAVVVIVTCPEPPFPSNGFIVNPRTTYNADDVITFRCNNGYDLIGQSQAICTNSGQFSGSLPSCRAVVVVVTCPAPPAPANGFIVNPSDSYNENGRITFGCNSGYELIGAAESTCTSSGRFSGIQRSCRAVTVSVTCAVPPSPTNGFIVNPQANYNVDTTITFACNNGYELVGLSEATCQGNGRFSGFLPSCLELVTQPVSRPCALPQIPVFGSIDNQQSSYPFGSIITFRCQDGYNLVGPSVATCGVNGIFSGGTRRCERAPTTPTFVTCRAPIVAFGSIVNGRANYNAGDEITVTCTSPFGLNGPATATCLNTGQFSELGRCQVTVSGGRCSVSAPDGGSIVGGVTSVPVGVVVRYACNPPYTLLGESSSVCQAGGTLQFPPPVCTECVPNPPENGFTVRDKSVWRDGDIITYDCLPGYRLQGLAPSLCQENGEIVGNTPTCILIDDNTSPPEACEPRIPENGRILFQGNVVSRVPIGRLYSFECNSGYNRIGAPAGLCLQNGDEAIEPPLCVVG